LRLGPRPWAVGRPTAVARGYHKRPISLSVSFQAPRRCPAGGGRGLRIHVHINACRGPPELVSLERGRLFRKSKRSHQPRTSKQATSAIAGFERQSCRGFSRTETEPSTGADVGWAQPWFRSAKGRPSPGGDAAGSASPCWGSYCGSYAALLSSPWSWSRARCVITAALRRRYPRP
jgi:hypothetical protein